MKTAIHFVLDRFLPKPQHPLLRNGSLHLKWRLGWVKGWLWRPYWWVRKRFGGTAITIGSRFSLQGKLILRGPGRVILGDDVIIDSVTTPYTHTSSAVISIGSRSFVNGTRFGAAELIQIGQNALLADARIMDTDFHSLHRDRNSNPRRIVPHAAVMIEDNVWIAASCSVLKGVRIGKDSVIALGSVVTQSIPAGSIAAGNPAKIISQIPID